jgi:hypothetical protein
MVASVSASINPRAAFTRSHSVLNLTYSERASASGQAHMIPRHAFTDKQQAVTALVETVAQAMLLPNLSIYIQAHGTLLSAEEGGAPDSVVLLVNSLSAAVHAAGLPTTGAPPDALPKRFLFSFKKLSTLLY